MKKVVVITGASAGVGRAAAIEFGKKGYAVGLIARGIQGLEGAKRDVENAGGSAAILQADVADADQVEKAAEQAEKILGPVDVWVNNAMASVFSPVKEMLPREYLRVTEVTYLGQVYGTLTALKRMSPINKGTIILVGSALAYRGIPLQSAYCASKHAIQGFFDSLRCELIHDKSNIQLSMVHLPAMNTPQFGWVKSRLPKKAKPMGTIFQPEVAARAIVYVSEHPRREIYVGFSTVQAIIGNKLFPSYADKVLAKKGYKGQQTDEPEDPNRKNNVWEPVQEDRGAHGSFDKDAKDKSIQFWITTHRSQAAIAGLVLAFLIIYLISLL